MDPLNEPRVPVVGLVPRGRTLTPAMEPTGLSESALYKQAGNAVCVGAVAAVARPLVVAGHPERTAVAARTLVDPAFAPPEW